MQHLGNVMREEGPGEMQGCFENIPQFLPPARQVLAGGGIPQISQRRALSCTVSGGAR